MIQLAIATGIPLSDLSTWDPYDLKTAFIILDDMADAAKDQK